MVRNEQLARKQQLVIKCNELENENKELKKENEKLKHKIEGQECVIETQAHNEEVYEKLVMKLEKENTELKKAYNTILNLIEKLQKENEQLRTEVNSLKKDISNMYDEEVIISIISDNFNLSRNEVLKLLGGE